MDEPRLLADRSVTEFMQHVLAGRRCSIEEVAELKRIVDACS